ncbi:MAG: outer membrane protein assembly factor BamE [bacterium]
MKSKSVIFRQLLPSVLGVLCVVWLCSSCATVGHDFASNQVEQIQIGKTTQAEIQEMFGSPWRVGIEDGLRTWTYGRYKYKLFGQSMSKDLVVRFDKDNVVVSYSFNTTEHDQ